MVPPLHENRGEFMHAELLRYHLGGIGSLRSLGLEYYTLWSLDFFQQEVMCLSQAASQPM